MANAIAASGLRKQFGSTRAQELTGGQSAVPQDAAQRATPVLVAQHVMATADAHYLEASLFERTNNA